MAVPRKSAWAKLSEKFGASRKPAAPQRRYSRSELVYIIDWPLQWTTRRAILPIEGWCFLLNGSELAGVRARVHNETYAALYPIARADVQAVAGGMESARNSGFYAEVPLAIGSSVLQLEAEESGGSWRLFAEQEVIREQSDVPEGLPLPPHSLMAAVAGGADDEEFRRSRVNGPAQLLADLVNAGINSTAITDVLDFGCGCGRFLAGWVMRGSQWRLYGCDYNPALVEWCNRNLPDVKVLENELREQLPYDAASFDLVYMLSVFTHLTLDEQMQLVREFRRITRPGGYVYVTFHGEPFHQQMFSQIEDGAEIFRRSGFLIGEHNQEGTNECWTLHSPEYLIQMFEGFSPVKHYRATERGPTDVASWQDSMIFQAL